MSIVYSKSKVKLDKTKILNLVTKNASDLETLNNVLEALLLKVKQDKENLTPDKLFLIEIWNRADEDGSGFVEEIEIYRLLRSLNINMPQRECKKLFNEFDIDKSKSLDFKEFSKFVEKLKERYLIHLPIFLCVYEFILVIF